MANTSLTPAEIQKFLDMPAGVPPPGVTPNFQNPPTNIHVWNVVYGVETALTTIVLAIRLFTRNFLSRSLATEDYLIILAFFAMIAQSVPTILSRPYSARHVWDLTVGDLYEGLHYINIAAITYCIEYAFIKVAILTQYLRIFVPSRSFNKPLWYGCWGTIITLVVFYIINMALAVAQCTPREKIWKPYLSGTCISQEKLDLSTGIFNSVSDFVILLLPMRAIYNLQMPKKKKLGVMCVFATGLFACLASIFRTYYTWRVLTSTDISWLITWLALWSWTEGTLGFVIFCLPTFPKFIIFTHSKLESFVSTRRKLSVDASEPLSEPLGNRELSSIQRRPHRVSTDFTSTSEAASSREIVCPPQKDSKSEVNKGIDSIV